VGQKFVELLDGHPWFEITALAASSRSAGKAYKEATNWIGAKPIPAAVADQVVVLAEPGLECDFVFSGLDARVAGDLERAFAEAGYPVISNARNYRMQADVPLLIPEVNPGHTALIDRQDWGSTGGYIVTNPNCSTVGLVCALKPLHDAFGLDAVQVTTMQALSGAGYPGVSSLDALGNVVPYIGGEEAKIASEPLKLLGTLADAGIDEASIVISAQCNRVPVLEGHLECVAVRFKKSATAADVRAALLGFESPIAALDLPTKPQPFLHVFDDERFPQPRRHSELGGGMTVSAGRIRDDEVLDVKFVVLPHTTLRGAAGGPIPHGELLVGPGRLRPRPAAVVGVACSARPRRPTTSP